MLLVAAKTLGFEGVDSTGGLGVAFWHLQLPLQTSETSIATQALYAKRSKPLRSDRSATYKSNDAATTKHSPPPLQRGEGARPAVDAPQRARSAVEALVHCSAVEAAAVRRTASVPRELPRGPLGGEAVLRWCDGRRAQELRRSITRGQLARRPEEDFGIGRLHAHGAHEEVHDGRLYR